MQKVLNAIHQASMQIAENTGVKFYLQEALNIFKENGIRTEGNVVYFKEEQLMQWIKKAPSAFTMYARNPEHNICIGDGQINCAPGYGASLIMEADGKRRQAQLHDYITIARIIQGNPDFHMNGGILVQPNDIPPDDAALLMFYAAYILSDKCMITCSGDRQQMQELMGLAMCAYGDEKEFIDLPRLLTIVNTNTPLQLDRRMLETLMVFAEYGQPIAVTAGAMAGSTAPVTLAGTLAVANTEILAAIALAQMIRPGTPVIYSTQCETSDMRNGSAAIGSPEGALCYQFSAHMAEFYGLPSRGGGCVTDANMVNAQAGYESMMTYLLTRQSRANLMIHSAGILDSYSCMSYEKLILDFEIMQYVKRLEQGISVEEDRIPLDVIHETGHGGQYLTSEHTLDYCRTEPLIPLISVRGGAQNSSSQLEKNIRNKLEQFSRRSIKPPVDAGILKTMKEFMAIKGVDTKYINKIEILSEKS